MAVLQFGFTPLAEKASNRGKGSPTAANQLVLLKSVGCTDLVSTRYAPNFVFLFVFMSLFLKIVETVNKPSTRSVPLEEYVELL